MKDSKKGKVALTITRPQSNKTGDYISLELEDRISGIRFVRLQISLEDFARTVTGLAYQEADAEFFGLEYVGKKRIREDRVKLCPLSLYVKREEMQEWLEKNGQEEGWLLDSYLGSQSSTYVNPGGQGTFLRYSVYKYVDLKNDPKLITITEG